MFRFDAKTGYYLYPEDEGENETSLWLNKGSTFENNVEKRDDIRVVKIGLKIPKGATDYPSFRTAMEESEKEFIRALSINTEEVRATDDLGLPII